MKITPPRLSLLLAASFAAGPLVALNASAQVVSFSPAAAGVTKSVSEWGVDAAWPNFDNVRQSIAHFGSTNVDVVRMTFHPAYPLTANIDGTYELSATAKGLIDAQLSLANLAGAKPLAMLPGDFGSTFDATHWARTIKATQRYVNSRTGFTNRQIKTVEVFNEPDYWEGEGTPAQLNTLIAQLKAEPAFVNTSFPAASTLNSNNARFWYDQVPAATQGSSHLLGGSMSSYVSFMNHVRNTGKPFVNPELHSLGEAIVGAEHGMASGIFWGDALRARGLFVKASDGKRLGYAENLDRQSAAAVYRAPDGQMYAFAGGVERFGKASSYRFVSDQDVYFNGIRVREYMLQTKWDQTENATAMGGDDFQNFGSWSNQGAYADIDLDGSGVPALDGYRWKIVNAATGLVMEVANSGTGDGSLIRGASDTDSLNQKWNIIRTRNGYYQLYNANSGRTAEVANGSLGNGAAVRQWGTADNMVQHWYIDKAGDGSFYIRNGHSTKYLTAGFGNASQNDLSGSAQQKWRFVLSAPVNAANSRYEFSGNVLNSTGSGHATAFGTPQYVNGPTEFGQAIRMSGDDYVQLPAGSANSTDMTISTWVKWDGGSSWQRIFDFGNNTTSYMFLSPLSGVGTMRFAITTTGNEGEQILDTAPLPVGQWTHLALTLGGNTGILYVNGSPRVAGQILLNPSDINATLNYLGKSQWADPLFAGMLDDFRIYDYALDASQIGSLVPRAWDVDADGIWSESTNWTYGAAPNGAGHSASFNGPFGASRTVSLDRPISVGTINFAAGAGVNLVGSSTLTLDALFGVAGVNVPSGSHTIATRVALNDDAQIAVASGASLSMLNAVEGSSRQLTKSGAGTLELAQIRNARLSVLEGVVRVASDLGGGTAGASQLTQLSVSPGASLDLASGALALDYSGSSAALSAQIRDHLLDGRLFTSAAMSDPSLSLGFADNAVLHLSAIDGLTVDQTTLILRVTRKGDTDLDLDVDFDDLLSLAQHYDPAGSNKVWTHGDSNYDGAVNFDDLLAMAQNYGAGTLTTVESAALGERFVGDWAFARALVPEPGAWLPMGSLAASLGAQRRQRRDGRR